jgi:hypothetical protein
MQIDADPVSDPAYRFDECDLDFNLMGIRMRIFI